MSARLAVYLAPELDEPLWKFGSSWLGYDAAREQTCPHPAIPGLPPELLHEATADPRLYGLHITLKAPFRLAVRATTEAVEEAMEALAGRHAPFGPFELVLETRKTVAGALFLCLVPREAQPALHALEAEAVRALDPFRAPLTPSEIARRNPDRLPARERRYLVQYGYPHVLDAFRPHLSLTGPIPAGSPLQAILAEHFSSRPELTRFACRSIALFEQPEAGSRFRIRRRFSLK